MESSMRHSLNLTFGFKSEECPLLKVSPKLSMINENFSGDLPEKLRFQVITDGMLQKFRPGNKEFPGRAKSDKLQIK